jgi:hypothetical protein
MQDLTIALEHRPGALADMGDALARAAISIEGGGAFAVQGPFAVQGQGAAHFLFHDGAAARRALEAAGIRVLQQREVLTQHLRQDQPGQLGKLTRRMAEAGVNIEVLYSDHEQRLILVVDDIEKGRLVSAAWERDRAYPDERGRR